MTVEAPVLVRVVEESLSEKTAFDQKPESCERTTCAKNRVSRMVQRSARQRE